jgi:hypothetical protein
MMNDLSILFHHLYQSAQAAALVYLLCLLLPDKPYVGKRK